MSKYLLKYSITPWATFIKDPLQKKKLKTIKYSHVRFCYKDLIATDQIIGLGRKTD